MHGDSDEILTGENLKDTEGQAVRPATTVPESETPSEGGQEGAQTAETPSSPPELEVPPAAAETSSPEASSSEPPLGEPAATPEPAAKQVDDAAVAAQPVSQTVTPSITPPAASPPAPPLAVAPPPLPRAPTAAKPVSPPLAATSAPAGDASGQEVAQPETTAAPSEPPAATPEAAAETPSAQPQSGPGAPMPGLPEAGAAGAEEVDDEPIAFEEISGDIKSDAPEIRPGTRRSGRIVSIEDTGVLVDFGAKVEGILPFDDFKDAEGNVTAERDQAVEVVFERFGGPGEYAVLSYRNAKEDEAWRKVEAAHTARETVEGTVTERVRGGLQVDIGVPAFLPGSQVDIRPIHDLEALIGTKIEVLVVKVNRRRGNVVVSRRELLEAEVGARKKETLSKLSEGVVVTGRVKNITSYGVFVDLGGLDGLIHLTDLSYGRIKDPSEVVKPGEEVTAKVIKFDLEKERVSLSVKHMAPDPWAGIEDRYKVGDRVGGRVASITDYGAFIELEPGVEGLIHITEMTWSRRLRHPSKVVSVEQQAEGVVLKVSPDERRISLSLKQLKPDPWELLGSEFQVGKIVEGRVRNVTTYGAFIEISEGIDGLVHVSDLTWDSRVKNPKEVVRKGQEIKAVILHVDQENQRLSLGVKQLEPDAWDAFLSENATGDSVPGLVTRIAKFGVFVEVAPGVEGLCHNSQVPRGRGKGNSSLQVGKRYEFEILRVNELDRKIGLRCESNRPIVVADPESQAVVASAAPDIPVPVAAEPVAGAATETVEPEAKGTVEPEANSTTDTPESAPADSASDADAESAADQPAESAPEPTAAGTPQQVAPQADDVSDTAASGASSETAVEGSEESQTTEGAAEVAPELAAEPPKATTSDS